MGVGAEVRGVNAAPDPGANRPVRYFSDLSIAVASVFFAGTVFAALTATVFAPEQGWGWPNPSVVAAGTAVIGLLVLLRGRRLRRPAAGTITGLFMVFLVLAAAVIDSLHRAMVAGVLIVGAILIFAWFMSPWVARLVGYSGLIAYGAVLATHYPGSDTGLVIVAVSALSVLLVEVFGRFKRRLQQASLTDHLCQVWNRAGFERLLEKEIRTVDRTHAPLSLLYLDLDGFKDVNDREGHLAGDRVLQEVSRSLEAGVRARDTVARIGGDEFVVILPKTTAADAQDLGMRLRREVTACDWSFGVAEYRSGESAQQFTERSDAELLKRKHARRAARGPRDSGAGSRAAVVLRSDVAR